MRVVTLGTLSDGDLRDCPAWKSSGQLIDSDKVLVPADLTIEGTIATTVGEVWCRSTCTFRNGATHPATAMYRGDRAEGPLAWTISFSGREIPLVVPPAPAFVIEYDGPAAFARVFGLRLIDIFPLVIKSDVRFAMPPSERSVHIGPHGILDPS